MNSNELNVFDLMVPAETLERRLDAMRRALDALDAALGGAEKENRVLQSRLDTLIRKAQKAARGER